MPKILQLSLITPIKGVRETVEIFFYYLPRSSLRNQTQGSLAGNVTAEAYPTLNAVIISTATQRNFQLIEDFIKSHGCCDTR